MTNQYNNLNAQKALIWRIVHRDNVPWILQNGIHCRSSPKQDPDYVNIGNPDLINKRASRIVPIPPGGVLNDYVPFYFTPFSPMLLNIKTGYGGIRQRNNDEIVIFVSSLHRLTELKIPFIFTDRHAYTPLAKFFSDSGALDSVDWDLLQRRDFKRDPDDPIKVERYQAEALVHGHVPLTALLGVICHNDAVRGTTAQLAKDHGAKLDVVARPGWYF
jgi:hypothetical protein